MVEYNTIDPKEEKKVIKEEVSEVVGSDKRPDKIVTGAVKVQKKGLVERLVVGMLGPDGIPGITSYLGHEIIMPALKNMVYDTLTNGLSMGMFGRDGVGRSSHHQSQGSNYGGVRPVARQSNVYGNAYRPASTAAPVQAPVQANVAQRRAGGNRVPDFEISDRNQAVSVLNSLQNTAMQYGNVSVADYYDMIGVEPQFTDNTYGWTGESIQRAALQAIRNGFVIKLPPVDVL